MDSKHLDLDGAERDGLAELFHEAGLSPTRAERMARFLFEATSPEFGEEDD